MITLNDIKDAKKRLDGTVYKTPLMKAPFLSTEKNAEIFFKEDNLQLTGSFKLRGAFNKVAMLDDVKKAAGVVAASAGNHAQGLAFAAQYFNCIADFLLTDERIIGCAAALWPLFEAGFQCRGADCRYRRRSVDFGTAVCE